MPFAMRPGLRLHYEEAGAGDPPLVFVHGWCCDRSAFAPQLEHFRRKHRVVAPDLRGFGRSDATSDGLDPASLADDIAWLCVELRLSRPVVVGHSLGGAVVLELGARHPTLPAAIVAVDPAPIDPPPELRAAFREVGAALRGPDAEAARRAFIENVCFAATDDAERKRRISAQMCAVPMPIAAAALGPLGEWDGGRALRACAAPVLLLLAAVGALNDPARLRALKPDVHIGVTVGAGHFHHLEVPEQVNAMIARFMQVAVTRVPTSTT